MTLRVPQFLSITPSGYREVKLNSELTGSLPLGRLVYDGLGIAGGKEVVVPLPADANWEKATCKAEGGLKTMTIPKAVFSAKKF